MNKASKSLIIKRPDSDAEGAVLHLKTLGIELPIPPEPFGVYAEAVQTGNLLFSTCMLPTEGGTAKFVGSLGAELPADETRSVARLAAVNVLAVARQHLASLDKVTCIVRLGVSVATSGDVRQQPKIADGAPADEIGGLVQQFAGALPPALGRRAQ